MAFVSSCRATGPDGAALPAAASDTRSSRDETCLAVKRARRACADSIHTHTAPHGCKERDWGRATAATAATHKVVCGKSACCGAKEAKEPEASRTTSQPDNEPQGQRTIRTRQFSKLLFLFPKDLLVKYMIIH